MGILFFSREITSPSVLWMRRMLEGLASQVAQLVTEVPASVDYQHRFRAAAVPVGLVDWYRRAIARVEKIPPQTVSGKGAAWLLRRVEQDDVDVVFVHYATLAVKYRRVWQQTNKPVVVHCHGHDVTWDMRREESLDRRAHPANYPRRVRELPANVRFVANSLDTQQRLVQVGVDEQRIEVHYLGVPVPEQPPAHAGSRDVTVLYLGRLVDCKGPVEVVQAFDLAARRGLQGRLVVAGDGSLRADCERARERSEFRDRIKLLGVVDANTGEQLRRQADIFTAHNRLGPKLRQVEAFGVSFVEAMASALPVVTGRSGALPEVVEDGVQGILFEPGDVSAHADALLQLADDPKRRHEMGLRGWQRARECFELEQSIAHLQQILVSEVAALG